MSRCRTVGTNALATASPRLDGLRRSFLGFRQGSLLPSTNTTVASIFWRGEFVPSTAAAVSAAMIHLVIDHTLRSVHAERT
jgi:hypothetical protein